MAYGQPGPRTAHRDARNCSSIALLPLQQGASSPPAPATSSIAGTWRSMQHLALCESGRIACQRDKFRSAARAFDGHRLSEDRGCVGELSVCVQRCSQCWPLAQHRVTCGCTRCVASRSLTLLRSYRAASHRIKLIMGHDAVSGSRGGLFFSFGWLRSRPPALRACQSTHQRHGWTQLEAGLCHAGRARAPRTARAFFLTSASNATT